MTCKAVILTDRDRISTRQLNRLRRRILRVYGTARREMQEQLTEFLAKYRALDERKRAQLDAGEITEEDYRIWLQNQVFQSDLMHARSWTASPRPAPQPKRRPTSWPGTSNTTSFPLAQTGLSTSWNRPQA